ncbi:MAG: carboxypeptidase-like regulatory domain-containing protein [Methanomassiliicoccales archaeon]|jgi:hypothetical protein
MRKLVPFALATVIFVSILCVAHSEVIAQTPGEWSISGSVTNETGAPLPDVNVTAVNSTSAASYHAMVNVSGEYNISLPVGIYNITASYTNYTANISYNHFRIGPGSLSVFDFRMIEILGTLSGYVTNGTVPVNGAKVVLSGERNYSATSLSPLGEYTIDRIVPGAYVAHAEKDGYQTATYDKAVVIIRGKTTELNFTLLEQPTTLFGKVTSGGNAIGDVKVTIASTEYTASTSTDANGNYALSNVPVGAYTLTFQKDGYEEKTVQVSLSPFENKPYDLTLDRTPVSSNTGFILGFDLSHSLMIVGLCLAIAILSIATYIRYRVGKNPDLLGIEREEEGEKPKEETEENKK